MIDAACVATSQVSGVERFDRLVDAKLATPSLPRVPSTRVVEGLVNHRGAPTCVETHVKTSIESVKTIYRLHLTEWTHAEQAHGDRSSAL